MMPPHPEYVERKQQQQQQQKKTPERRRRRGGKTNNIRSKTPTTSSPTVPLAQKVKGGAYNEESAPKRQPKSVKDCIFVSATRAQCASTSLLAAHALRPPFAHQRNSARYSFNSTVSMSQTSSSSSCSSPSSCSSFSSSCSRVDHNAVPFQKSFASPGSSV